MKIKINKKLLLAGLAAASIVFPAAVRAEEIRIEVWDRPYYTHGHHYWDHDWEMVWVPGHWDEHHRWIHGRYARGEHRHHHDDDHR
ncbi:MAG TPA: hypothetical protein VGG94_08650 [Chthoniobacterales bacterium]